MIFTSVGSMLPFDRLVRAVDDWAAANRHVPVLIQIGDGTYQPRHADWVRIMPHDLYARRLAECTLFVAHVGIGSIFQALEARKQLLMLPRLATLASTPPSINCTPLPGFAARRACASSRPFRRCTRR